MSAEECRELILKKYRDTRGVDLYYWQILEELPISFFERNKDKLLRAIGRGE